MRRQHVPISALPNKEQTGESADCEKSPFPLRNMRGSAHPAAWIRDERMLLARHVATQRAILRIFFLRIRLGTLSGIIYFFYKSEYIRMF